MKITKKLAAGLLALALLSSLALPALAAGADLDARLKAVTLKVKETLDIGDDYTEFTGNLTESDPAAQWSLYWSKDDESLQVRATEEGKILYYSLYRNTDIYSGDDGNIAKFPDSAGTARAKDAAEAFLAKVLDTGIESVDLESYTDSVLRYYSSGSCSFYGTLKLNGTDTPISVNLSVDTGDMQVVSFYRSDSGEDYSSLSVPGQAISVSAASPVLFSTVNMYLSYALRDGDDKTAYLQYTPVSDGSYAVDAVTGKLVSLNTYLAYMGYENAKSPSVAYDSASGLTQVELDTAAGLKDVLSRDTLEAAARNISEFGITSDFSLRSVNYYAGTGDSAGSVTAYLSFYSGGTASASASVSSGVAVPASDKVSSGSVSSYKYVTLDAKTAALISFSSYRGSDDKNPELLYTRSQAETVARNFLAKYEKDRLAVTSLASSEDAEGSETCTFVYQHTVNGIPFPQNSLYVTVDAVTGNISAFSVSWTDDIEFVSAANVIPAESAKGLYTAAEDLVLSYVYVSEDTEDGFADSHLLLAYTFDSRNTVWGVDAVSGALLRSESSGDTKLAYDDISSHYARDKIEKLAQYGIGFSGGSFFPDRQLTQKDLLTLLIAACGNYYGTPVSETEEDSLYLSAYSLGILTKEEKAPDSLVTRAELVKLVLRAAGYGRAAEIPDIYVVKFADASAVPSGLTGYVAIARGLGIISGTPEGKFLPSQVATRAEAAVVLYNYMST
ncbi:YcdB/YcdC domain-containing protein [Papillibacter cinnamivorans]|uniref:S-layer homology domain-containing protein n=1 Tax=Papillibacter cinnamivorans DSM 12816 TaxID=1122930 RepID=A0A1W1ZHZ9_9FIRM|nr:YcdB/YcdC domain-containing protein [Papillibacter cinnamivorans]SMC47994.1 S-layer homology domain-containing protein [Papillibacter cinnamivorans DSM 12816]